MGRGLGNDDLGSTPVPAMGPLYLALLAGALLGAASVLYRKRLVQAALTCSIVALALAPFVAVALASVPHTFVNGTVADANEVNENFSSIVDSLNSVEHFLIEIDPSFHGPLPVTHQFSLSEERAAILLISGSAFSSSPGQEIGVLVSINGFSFSSKVFTNVASSHVALMPGLSAHILPAGTNTVVVQALNASTQLDGNDLVRVHFVFLN